jgi:formylglycine-generating enzyme required for sulfatase activity/Spy/CpxP family protein refolding chaperone
MTWPTVTDYSLAVQNLGLTADDEELRVGEAKRNRRGLPILWTGNFAAVFRIDCPASGNTWALKCFTREVRGLQDRYRQIAAHLEQARLPFTVDFQYLEQGIHVAGGWFPALKMRWVEGLTLNEFVEEHLDRPVNLRMLLDLWVKLAARLRQAGMAHADLQHGNVLLVPTGEALALRLIDYDGMYVPALSGQRSGEVGHPAYQHPQRLREGTYNAEVDRFSHLAIYTAIRCLAARPGELWRRFNNGDNLLFRPTDFDCPGDSDLFRTLWALPDADVRALVGRLVLACQRPLAEAPLLDQIVADGTAQPLGRAEQIAVESVLAVPKPPRVAGVPPMSSAPGALRVPPVRATVGLPSRVAGTAGQAGSGTQPRRRVILPLRAMHWFDGLLAAMVGKDNELLHNFFRVLSAVGLVLLVGLTVKMALAGLGSLVASKGSPAASKAEPEMASAQQPGHRGRDDNRVLLPGLKPITSQTVEAGKELMVDVSVGDSPAATGEVRFAIGPGAPTGAMIDARTGRFAWTPTQEQGGARYDVTVSARASDGRSEQTAFNISVTRPIRLLDKEIAADLGGGVKLKLVLIPPGEFLMGSRESAEETVAFFNKLNGSDLKPDRYRSEHPQHRVRITRPFYLGTYHVTRGQFRRFVELTGYKTEAEKDGKGSYVPTGEKMVRKPECNWQNAGFEQTDNHPVVNVSWNDAVAFCTWLSRKEDNIYRLPTEAEWEYACRAGTTTRYYNGDDPEMLTQVGNVADAAAKAAFPDWKYTLKASDGFVFTAPVGQFRPNAFGLYDMHGNALELCSDWFNPDYYTRSPTDDPTGPESGSVCVARGSCWHSRASACRSARRMYGPPASPNNGLGFRVARVAESLPGTVAVSQPLKLQPVAAQTVEAGKSVTVAVAVENADAWKGKLRYSLDPQSPAGAVIDPVTGVLSWTPAQAQGPGEYDLTVSVEGPGGQKETTAIAITVSGTKPAPTPAPGREISVELGNGVNMRMVLIPAGEFMMGSGESAEETAAFFKKTYGWDLKADSFKNEHPQHRVRITSSFCLGTQHVTRGQFRQFVNDTNYKTDAEKDGKGGLGLIGGKFVQKPEFTWRNAGFEQAGEHPVINVSWNDAKAFCDWLSGKDGKSYRLPTEAEWEYACRAGTTTQYWCGNDPEGLAQVANVADATAKAKLGLKFTIRGSDGYTFTSPAGSFRSNLFGLYDMHGNAMQWCADRYNPEYYAVSPANDPTGSENGAGRVIRGGSCLRGPDVARSARRGLGAPDARGLDTGFRVARVAAGGLPGTATVSQPPGLQSVPPQTTELGKTSASASPSAPAGKMPERKPRPSLTGHMVDRATKGLTLSDEQVTRLDALCSEFDPKMLEVAKKINVLTPEQKKKMTELLKSATESSKHRVTRNAMDAAINLTDEQKAKRDEGQKEFRAVYHDFHAKVQAILTPEQREQVKKKGAGT